MKDSSLKEERWRRDTKVGTIDDDDDLMIDMVLETRINVRMINVNLITRIIDNNNDDNDGYDYDNKNDCKRHESHLQRDILSHQMRAAKFCFQGNEVS